MTSFPLMPVSIALVSLSLGILVGWFLRAIRDRGEINENQEQIHDLSLELFETGRERDDLQTRHGVRTRELERIESQYSMLRFDRDTLEQRLALLLRGRERSSVTQPVRLPGPERGMSVPRRSVGGPDLSTGPQVRVRRSTVGWWKTERPSAYPLERIGDIDPSHAGRLRELGIATTYDLLVKASRAGDRRRLAQQIARPGVTEHLVQSWAQVCDLMRVPGINSHRAKLLLSNGVPSVEKLARREPSTLRSQLETFADLALDELPDRNELAGWIEAAQTLEP